MSIRTMTTAELAEAVKSEQIEFAEALLFHLERQFPDHYSVEAFFILSMALGYLGMGRPEVTLELGEEKATAEEWIRRFDLEPFL